MSVLSAMGPRRIEWRLPLAIAALLLVVVSVLSWAAYREVRASALRAAEDRAVDVGGQLATLLTGSINSLLDDATRTAADSTLLSALSGDAPDSTSRVVARLEEELQSRSSLLRIELWDTLGALRAVAARPADGEAAALETAPAFPDWAVGRSASAGPFGPTPSGATYAVAAPVRSESGRLGVLVYHLALTTSDEAVEQLEGLVGAEAAFVVGVPGGVWTDLVRVVEGPPQTADGQAVRTTYENGSGRAVIGGGTPVEASPWVAWVEFPRDGVLAPARALLTRFLFLGTGVVVLGSLGGWTLSRDITTRLGEVTEAAGAIAAGEESRRVPPTGDDELTDLARAFNRMAEEVEQSRQGLEDQVRERTAELREREEELRKHAADLEATNHELDAFCYSVSHDLRAPLRAIDGFSRAVLEEHGDSLDEQGASDLRRVCAAAARMGLLIDDLLELSRAARIELNSQPVNLTRLAERIAAGLSQSDPGRDVEFRIEPDLVAMADHQLVRLVLDNLLGNAWKFTSERERAVVEVARSEADGAFLVRDNGAGFDMDYADKLFDPFQRLHSDREFAGTGVGLTLVERIIRRHGGSVWGEGATGEGATFYFTLPEA